MIRELVGLSDQKKVPSAEAAAKTTSLVEVSALNALPAYGNEIRDQIGYSVRNLAISAWNAQNDIRSALALINLALQIHTSDPVKAKFNQDLADLKGIESNHKGIFTCYFCDKHKPDAEGKLTKNIYKVTSRTYFPRRVQYNYTTIDLPRCKHCKKIQDGGQVILWIVFVLFTIGGFCLGASLDGIVFQGGCMGALVGYWVGKLAERIWCHAGGVKAAQNSALKRHPLMADLVKEKWQFEKPRA
jgi:hypothetical protein